MVLGAVVLGAVVLGAVVVPGAAPMWDLTLAQVHTFGVGAGQWVVHNCDDLIANAKQAADDQGRVSAASMRAEGIGGDPVDLEASTFTSGPKSAEGPFEDIINEEAGKGAPHSEYAGGCGERFACQALYDHADALDGGHVDMGMYHGEGEDVCPTCQRILQRTSDELNVTIHLETQLGRVWNFLPGGAD